MNPCLEHQESVDFVRKYQLFEGHMIVAKTLRQIDSLLEGNISVVISLNQQHWRLPRRYSGIGRGLERQLFSFLDIRRRRVVVGAQEYRPVMHAMEVHTRGEDIGVTRESERGKISAVG